MGKKVSRKGNRAAVVLLALFGLFFLLGKVADSGPFLLISIVLLLACGVVMLRTNRCPYCGETFRGLYWDQPTAGHCRKCGKMIEFDDPDHDDGGCE